ncbi:hypothetical protein L0U85_16505 [Glycomyces sp. L485]|uniref:hypothetical protein n=1 Tax=Glycomyces sp. L485 TaxID=2909235 RepID=UPI001F4A0C4E|nr:hypothetical protein [Glycomyces sp. L485]MCH7232441.1 hypothetical protein [Glycomyces sp. L485]
MRIERKSYVAQIAVVIVASLFLVGCGGSESGPDDPSQPTESNQPQNTEQSDDSSGDEPDAALGTGTATIDGVTYSFPDVRECEIDGDTWGEGWRHFLGWSEDGHSLLEVTVANDESQALGATSSLTITIGTQEANTVDGANPDSEWSDQFVGNEDFGADLSPNGAAGTTGVGMASGETGSAQWAFSCT